MFPPEPSNLPNPIPRMRRTRHTKNLIQLLQLLPLRLGHQQQHRPPPDKIPARIPRKRALGFKLRQQAQPRHAQQEIEEPGGGRGERDAERADVEWEGFGGVGEGHGARAGRVDHAEEVDAEGDAGDALGGVFGEEEGEAGEEEEDEHEGESGEEEVAAAEAVDGPEGGEGEEEVNDAEAEGCAEGFLVFEATFAEDGGAVVCDYVDAAELHNRNIKISLATIALRFLFTVNNSLNRLCPSTIPCSNLRCSAI